MRDAEPPTEAWLLVEIAEPGTYDFSFDGCESLGTTSATLFDESGSTELGSSTAVAGECPHLGVELAEAGTYALRVETDSAASGGATYYVRADSAR